MDSRSKKLIKLAIASSSIECLPDQNGANINSGHAENSGHNSMYLNDGLSNHATSTNTTVVDTTLNKDLPTTSDNDTSVISVRQRSESSSSSSSSCSSSSSSSSSISSFNEDSDDSVKDPDYRVKELEKTSDSENDVDAGSSNQTSKQSPGPCAVFEVNHHEQMTLSHDPETEVGNVSILPPQSESVLPEIISPTKKGRKRRKQESNWKKNVAKRLRNSGQPYIAPKTQKAVPKRALKPPCKENCTFKCRSHFTDDQRQQLLTEYWALGEIEKQWTFIANNVEIVVPKHRYVKVDSDGNIATNRSNNNAFFLTIVGNKYRVCKTFFKNTLSINNRPIETALKKKNKDSNIFTMKDNRGCHQKQPKVEDSIKNRVKEFIEAIPKIESHYTRANSKRHYIDGSKAITDLHRDYVEQSKSVNLPYANYIMFYRIFTEEFNISFFSPKKDLCDVCEAHKNSTDQEKESKKEEYENHHKEKLLSRTEKEADKNILVAVYDLQAVFQCPKGEISVFYYKSKLNVLNLTIYDLHKNSVECYVWDESNANRGVNEIGTCVYNYLAKVSSTAKDLDVVFYSDNCAGQQKNKFMISMYLYAVMTLPNLNSVTHKFLIKGHTQNEGDSAHSQIEREIKRQLRSGPMYTPDAFIGAIKAARKKSEPMHVTEMCFDDFYDWKSLCSQINFNIQKDEDNNTVKFAGIKVVKVQKSDLNAIFFKDSYANSQFKKATVVKKKRNNFNNLELKKAYSLKPGLAERKKSDLMDLVNKNLIPRYHRPFFESL